MQSELRSPSTDHQHDLKILEGEDAEAVSMPQKTLPEFALKARDLDSLRSAVVDAANVSAGLWLSYLFTLFYLAIAVSGVTHRDLFFEKPIKLPFLNVELPLVLFFTVGPILFVTLHAYVLLHFMLLADKAGAFHTQLRTQIDDEDIRARIRRQLPSNIFVQFVAGTHELRSGWLGALFRLIAEVSLIVFPLLLLIFFLFQFLPYHSSTVTWVQRVAILADIGLLWMIWPSIARGEISRLSDFKKFTRRVVVSVVFSSAVMTAILGVATFPGEWLHEHMPSLRIIPTKAPWDTSDFPPPPRFRETDAGMFTAAFYKVWDTIADRIDAFGWVSLHKLIVAGEVDPVSRKPTSVWSNRLVLPQIEPANGEVVSLRGRRLDGVVLLAARLPNADFTGAHLREALLDGADLKGAQFTCGAASLSDGEGRDHNSNVLRKDVFDEDCAQLQGASFINAKLQGAVFDGARLRGALLQNASMHGASLRGAQADGASFEGAKLHAVSLDFGQFNAAKFTDSEIYGASILRADFSGADFFRSQLQGTQFRLNLMNGASFRAVLVWRASGHALLAGSEPLVRDVFGSPQYHSPECPVAGSYFNLCEWRTEKYQSVRRAIEETVSNAELRRAALLRIEILDPSRAPGPVSAVDSYNWIVKPSEKDEDWQNDNAKQRAVTAASCRSGGGYVIRAQVLSGWHDARGPLAQRILAEDYCPGLQELTLQERRLIEYTARR